MSAERGAEFGPAGRVEEAELVPGFPPAQAGVELDSVLQGGPAEELVIHPGPSEAAGPPPPAEGKEPLRFRPRLDPDVRWSHVMETLDCAHAAASRRGAETLVVRVDMLGELLRHVDSLEAGLRWAGENGPCTGTKECAWHEGLYAASGGAQ